MNSVGGMVSQLPLLLLKNRKEVVSSARTREPKEGSLLQFIIAFIGVPETFKKCSFGSDAWKALVVPRPGLGAHELGRTWSRLPGSSCSKRATEKDLWLLGFRCLGAP